MGKVLTIGEMLMRLTPKNMRRINQATEFQVNFGGAEANVAIALSKFGHEVQFLSVFPENHIGATALEHLKGAGVDTKQVFHQGERLGLYYYEEGFSIMPPTVIYDRNYSSIHRLSNIEIDWQDLYNDVDILHITGITPALSNDMKQFTLKAVKKANDFNVKVSFDFNYRTKLWDRNEAKKTYAQIMPYVNICFAGFDDLYYFFDEKEYIKHNEDHLSELYSKYSGLHDIEVFAATDRQVESTNNHKLRGYLFKDNRLTRTPYYSIDIIDRIGGGDAFAAGILHGLLMDMNVDDIVHFGMASGVMKHMIRGDYIQFTDDEIYDFLNGHRRITR